MREASGVLILLVEDERILRSLTERLLTRAGYRVFAAADADGARALIEGEARAAQLLITDLELPGTGGRQLARELLATRAGLAVLFISGSAFLPGVRQEIDGEGHALLGKPYSSEALLEQVRLALARA